MVSKCKIIRFRFVVMTLLMVSGCAGFGHRLETPRVKLVHIHKNEQLKYALKGKIRLGGNSFAPVMPFSSEGSLPIKDFVSQEK
jgi:hypothetical protein